MVLHKSKKYTFIKRILLVGCIIIAGNSCYAAKQKLASSKMSLVGFHLLAGFKERTFSFPNTQVKPKTVFGFGFDYEYQNGLFLMTTGADFAWHRIANTVADTSITLKNILDSEGDKYNLTYDFKHRRDNFSFWTFTVPILAGIQYEYLYAKIGPKLGVMFSEIYKPTLRVTTTSDYPFTEEDPYNIDHHGLRQNAQVNPKIKSTDVKPYITLSAEVGVNLFRIKKYFNTVGYSTQLKIGVFFDYTLTAEHTKDRLKLFEIDEKNKFDFDRITFNPLLTTEEAYKTKVHNFIVGVSITFIIDVSLLHRNSPCITCF